MRGFYAREEDMIERYQFRCTFRDDYQEKDYAAAEEDCREKARKAVADGRVCNFSFYRYKDMGFVYVEVMEDMAAVKEVLGGLTSFLKPWPREEGDTYFVPMINVYYHHIPDEDIDVWEKERTTKEKTRIGRIAFVYPEKLTSYILHHKEIVDEGLLKGDKYAYISMHENLLFSYYEEPRNNVNISGRDEESKAIERWLAVDPESHFDREKAEGSNFLVIPQIFSVDRVDFI